MEQTKISVSGRYVAEWLDSETGKLHSGDSRVMNFSQYRWA